MKDETLASMGTLLDKDMPRDAVHIACAAVVAGEAVLLPGDHIGFLPDGSVGRNAVPIGIVDPYLRVRSVGRGQRFWLFLYPGSITSLKHLWTHPAFAADAPAHDRRAASEEWLREFCERGDCPGYETVLGAAARVADGGVVGWSEEFIHFNGLDASGEIPPEFWDHVEVVLGRPIRGYRATGFSCSC